LSASEIAGFLDSTDAMPDGIFAASDMVALAAIQVLTSRGVAVPEQVRVLGYDDLPIAQGSIPPLTTIRQDIASGALQLVDCLLKRIAGKATGSIILRPELILRGSA
jgi:DNA-binding LacI/PurR family transcriptional regulator